ncbi:MAG: ATP-dependent DNA helicase RecG [Alphaproteobacteria bacterium]|nr:ATP-dependent DNA helicase RecG [Alphaproteobacteria bacterium]
MRPALLHPVFADITTLPGVGPKMAALISKVAGPRIIDLLMTPPTGLIDRSRRPTVADATPGERVTMLLEVDRHEPPSQRRRPYRILCSDETGFVTLVYFHAKEDYLRKLLPEGSTRVISGALEDYGGAKQMPHPDFVMDPQRPEDLPLFEPVYPLTAGLHQSVMSKAMRAALRAAPVLPEWQERTWLEARKWPAWREALSELHAPEGAGAISASAPSRARLAYDELLADQLTLALVRAARRKSPGRSFRGDGAMRRSALAALPFSLTSAQVNALADIDADMTATTRMARLVQGDVGSGKTLVAFLAMLNAVEAGAQAALMAPTEILARQHLQSLKSLAEAVGVTLITLTGADKGEQRTAKLAGVAKGYVDIVIGTHALFQESVAFHDLGLVVVDEQHRFGVRQRLALTEKGPQPDMLVMTATPIPRTLALTAYGDMDVSAIREKPPGRKPIATRTIPLERLHDVIAAVRRALQKGEQVYWVCPLVEESDALALTAAETRYADLKDIFGDRVGMVHGRMSSAAKEATMSAFHEGRLGLLIATTVIEVGVDAPNATAIVIEHAERFGLAQLHQLRGRVGRGGKPGACLLLYKGPLGETAKARLSILRDSEDGFRLAEEDLRLRGSGDLLGSAQSGAPRYRLADFSAHGELLTAARDDAELVLRRDPRLQSERGKALVVLLHVFERAEATRLLSA